MMTIQMVRKISLAICAVPTVVVVTTDVGGFEAVAVVVCHFGSGTRLLDRRHSAHGREAACLTPEASAERHADPETQMCPRTWMLHSREEEEALVHAETAQLSYAVSAIQTAPNLIGKLCNGQDRDL